MQAMTERPALRAALVCRVFERVSGGRGERKEEWLARKSQLTLSATNLSVSPNKLLLSECPKITQCTFASFNCWGAISPVKAPDDSVNAFWAETSVGASSSDWTFKRYKAGGAMTTWLVPSSLASLMDRTIFSMDSREPFILKLPLLQTSALAFWVFASFRLVSLSQD